VSTDASSVLAGRPVLRRALVPVGALLGVVAGSIAGFVVLADVGLVEATFWLISPETVELHIRDEGGPATALRGFAVLSRVGLVVSSLWIGQTVLAALFGGKITEELKRVQQERTISSLSNHVVVCGYGMFGQTVANRLASTDRDIVVVEREDETVADAERDGHLVVDGDARKEATLERAHVAEAETIIAAIDNSNVNIQVAVLARQLAPGATLVVRIGDQMYASTAERAGADVVVIPEVMSGGDLAEQLTGG
jgi:voltage-gated potassium channel